MKRQRRTPTLFASLLFGPMAALAQGGGPLIPPPGAPMPTMKTLDQVEARTPLIEGAADSSAVTISDTLYHFIITEAGSYYLTGNLDVTKFAGIDIRAADVTLDLNGFEIRRAVGSGGSLIRVNPNADRCTVKNGSLSGSFSSGLQAVFGSDGATNRYPRGGTARQLAASGCSSHGLRVGSSWEVVGCEAHDNGLSGISGPESAVVATCTASENGASGISVGVGSTVISCISRNNATNGISAGSNSAITGCTTFENGGDGISGGIGSTITGCSSRANSGDGILGAPGSTISGCTSTANVGDGIQVSLDCLVLANACGGDAAGIHSTSYSNRIEANLVANNNRGIDVDSTGSLIIKNSAAGNTTNYAIAASNKVGVIVSAPNSGAINGSSGGAGVGTTDPWANFSF